MALGIKIMGEGDEEVVLNTKKSSGLFFPTPENQTHTGSP